MSRCRPAFGLTLANEPGLEDNLRPLLSPGRSAYNRNQNDRLSIPDYAMKPDSVVVHPARSDARVESFFSLAFLFSNRLNCGSNRTLASRFVVREDVVNNKIQLAGWKQALLAGRVKSEEDGRDRVPSFIWEWLRLPKSL